MPKLKKKNPTPEAVADPRLAFDYYNQFKDDHMGMDPEEWERFQQSSGVITPDRSYLLDAVTLASGVMGLSRLPRTLSPYKDLIKRTIEEEGDVFLKHIGVGGLLEAMRQAAKTPRSPNK